MADFTRDRDSAHDHELVLEEDLLLDEEPRASVGRSSRRSELRELRVEERPLDKRPVRVGDLLAGKYSVERVHPSGAHGLTVDAEHLQLGQRVSLKMSLSEGRAEADGAARFLRGARFAAQLRSAHVARVVDLGTLDSGAAYVVTEHLAGTDLRGVLRVREWLPVPEAVDYVLQACVALAEAHVAGFVHRNLKPSNLFLARDEEGRPSLKVLDFCIAEGAFSDAVVTSPNRSRVSSLAYLAPEQVRDPSGADVRADIWALGAVLYELLTGAAAFAAASAPGLFAAIAADAPTPPTQLQGDIPAELEAIVLRCLEKEREYRYPGVGELVRQLRPFASEAGQDSVEQAIKILERRMRSSRSIQPPALHGLLGVPPTVAAPTAAPGQPSRARRAVELGIVALGVLGCAVGIGAFIAIRNVQAALAARPPEQAVIASLSPALTAPQPVASAVALEPGPALRTSVAARPLANNAPQRLPVAAALTAKPAVRGADLSQPDPMAQAKTTAANAAPARGLFDDAN